MSDPQIRTSPQAAVPAKARDLSRIAWVIAPMALTMVGYAFFLAEGRDVDHEIHLLTPAEVQVGDPIPVRARVFEDIRFAESAALSTRADLEVSLVQSGSVRATLRLRPAGHSYEGSFATDSLGPAPGELELRARLLDGDTVLATCSRTLRYVREAPAAPIGGRLVSSLALLDLGPITMIAPPELDQALDPELTPPSDAPLLEAAAPPPLPSMDVRVVGGVCLPEERCVLLIASGEPFTLELQSSGALSVSEPSAAGPGVTRVEVVVHGPEASTMVRVAHEGRALAERSLRLPVALATPWLELAERSDDAGVVDATLHPPPGRERVVIDAYLEGRWLHTGTMDTGESRLPFALERRGLWRLQAHVDPFSSDHAAARHIVVGPALDVAAALRREQLGMASLSGAPDSFLLAAAEEDVRALPRPSSGLEADLARLFARRTKVRWIGGVALVLGLVLLAGALFLRGLDAEATARKVMLAAGDAEAQSARTRIRGALEVSLIVGAILLAFLAGTTLVFARALLG